MILSVAHASVEEADSTNMFGIWSNMVVGERPEGLVNAYLLEGEGAVYVHSVWDSRDAHDRAIESESNHPAYGFFEACGLDPTHTVYQVIGHLH